MKILIVDDSAEKTKDIASAIRSIDSSISIENSTHASEARSKLREKEYDIVVLDLALPKDIYMDPDQEVGYRLLTEILDSGTLIPPKKIFCLTEFQEVYRDYSEVVSEELVAIHQFAFNNNSWKNALEKEINRQSVTCKLSFREFDLDILFVCALKTPELEEILDLDISWKEPEIFENILVVHHGELLVDNVTLNIVATSFLKMGAIHAGIMATKLIDMYRPRCVVMTGISAGDVKETNLGDIIVASPSWSWESGKWQQDEGAAPTFQIEPHQLSISPKIVPFFELLSSDRRYFFELHDSYKGDKPAHAPKMLSGPVACGSSVIASGDFYEQIKKQNRKLIGLEMEAYGLYSACELAADPKPKYFCIKAVSDFADGSKSDSFQRYASHVSARTALEVVKRYHHILLG
ncbi:hypothetical protein AB6C60_07685 [Vibrio cyclitrophicus]